MNHKKVGCFLLILFYLLGNVSTMASNRLIICKADKDNQKYICVDDAVVEVKPHLGAHIYIVAYGGPKRIPCTGQRIADAFMRQLLDTIEGQGTQVNESLFKAVDGGFRDEALIEIYVCGANEQPPKTAKWPPSCR